MISCELASGTLPKGLNLAGNHLSGTPTETGLFPFRVRVIHGSEKREQDFALRVHGQNLAPLANEILYNESPTKDAIELVRDGKQRSGTFYNRAPDGEPRVNWYGYAWDAEHTVSTIVYNPGLPEEWGGWFTSLEVQYRDANGQWKTADLLSIDPPMNFDDSQWLKGSYIDYSLSITPITTTAIRIIGSAGGIEQDERNGGARRFYTAISELAVYPD